MILVVQEHQYSSILKVSQDFKTRIQEGTSETTEKLNGETDDFIPKWMITLTIKHLLNICDIIIQGEFPIARRYRQIGIFLLPPPTN
jgi:hypothetical protein